MHQQFDAFMRRADLEWGSGMGTWNGDLEWGPGMGTWNGDLEWGPGMGTWNGYWSVEVAGEALMESFLAKSHSRLHQLLTPCNYI